MRRRVSSDEASSEGEVLLTIPPLSRCRLTPYLILISRQYPHIHMLERAPKTLLYQGQAPISVLSRSGPCQIQSCLPRQTFVC